MYRGDDIYLLDFWPLDEQNTLGGGVAYFFGETNLRLHVGINRLDDSFQTQTIVVPAEEFGTREVLFMDRQRGVFTLRGEHSLSLGEALKLKMVLYGELHTLPAGTRQTEDNQEEWLPADNGWLAGAELSLFGFGEFNHVNLYLRYGSSLAAYDEMAIPLGPGREKSAQGAKEFLAGLSANYEIGNRAGLLLGAYGRYFEDADPNVYDRDDLWEVGFACRPAWYVTEHFHILAEANLQYLRPSGLSVETDKHEIPFVFEVGIMPSISLKKGSYARPQLRLVYAVTLLNHAALRTFAPEDPQRKRATRHYLGLSVEWWFHSSRYGM
jgi:maltoporin